MIAADFLKVIFRILNNLLRPLEIPNQTWTLSLFLYHDEAFIYPTWV